MNAELTTWIESGYSYPYWVNNGLHSIVWRDTLNIPNRDGNLVRYQPGGRALVSSVGPTKDDGLPEAPGYTIQGLAGELNFMYMFLRKDADTSEDTEVESYGLRLGGSPLGHRSVSLTQKEKRVYILEGREGGAWNTVYTGANYSDNDFTAMTIGSLGERYGVFFVQTDNVLRYLPLIQVFNNPNIQTRQKFVEDKWQSHFYPYFDGDDSVHTEESDTSVCGGQSATRYRDMYRLLSQPGRFT